jgi:peptide/nickel transport system permease protein
VTLLAISMVCFFLVQLPPGDWLDIYASRLAESGGDVEQQLIDNLRDRYGLGDPLPVQYLRWIGGIVTRGDFGYSFLKQVPVSELIWSRMGMTLLLTVSTMVFVWLIGLIFGVYSATHKNTLGDYLVTFLGFIGLSIPNFVLALVLISVAVIHFDSGIASGLFSVEYATADWSFAKLVDLLKHLWVPVIVIGTAGTAGLIRVTRGNMLDVLDQDYIRAARAKGLRRRRVVFRHALKNCMHPLIMSLGMMLPRIISGATVTSIVLSLPTAGHLFYESLRNQDMYLASTFLMLLAGLLVLGNLMADIILAMVDPRITFD